jgi:hypothetical protein
VLGDVKVPRVDDPFGFIGVGQHVVVDGEDVLRVDGGGVDVAGAGLVAAFSRGVGWGRQAR